MIEIVVFDVAVSIKPNVVEWKDFDKRKNHFRWTAEERIPAKVSLLVSTLDRAHDLSSKEGDSSLRPISTKTKIKMNVFRRDINEKCELYMNRNAYTENSEQNSPYPNFQFSLMVYFSLYIVA
jgi:hypothetical protein